ncbi:MAG: glycosyltransferase family 2 protein [Clostridia bacterium]|nr:glycosyltransferase family 2 protein [Clostridia bacterium]
MSEEQDLISVIVPIYKVEKYIEKCLHTITNQSYKNLEIVLVDDGSPDNCPKICDDWAKKDKRIKVIHKQNGGVMSAWTTGFKFSTGKYTTFCDPDDYYEFNAIEKLYKPLKENNADMSICGIKVVYANKTINRPAFEDKICGVFENEELEKIKVKSVNQINSYFPLYKCNKLFKSSLIKNNLKYCDEKVSLGDDCCITLGSLLDSKKIVVIEDFLYNYIQRTTSIIHAYNEKLLLQFETLLNCIKTLITDKNYFNEKTICYEQTRMLFILSRNFINSSNTKKEKKQIYKDILESDFVLKFKENKDFSSLPKLYKIFKKVFLTKNYFLLNLLIKTHGFIKRLKVRTIQ